MNTCAFHTVGHAVSQLPEFETGHNIPRLLQPDFAKDQIAALREMVLWEIHPLDCQRRAIPKNFHPEPTPAATGNSGTFKTAP
jgi:hypothetical protein